MELIKGTTLGELMGKEKLTIAALIEIIEEVAEALAEAHHQGIIHRDIKPSNIAINERGRVKVLDFGLAKQLELSDRRTRRQTLLQYADAGWRHRWHAHVFVARTGPWGTKSTREAICFRSAACFTNASPASRRLSGRTAGDICAESFAMIRHRPRNSTADVSTELDRITLKALAKKPEDRYQTAEEMIADLQTAHSQALGLDRTITRIDHAQPRNTHPTSALATLSDIFRRPRLSDWLRCRRRVGVRTIDRAGFGISRARDLIEPTPRGAATLRNRNKRDPGRLVFPGYESSRARHPCGRPIRSGARPARRSIDGIGLF